MTMFFGVFFLLFLFVLMPRSAMKSRRILDSPKGQAMGRPRMYLMTMLSMFFIALMTLSPRGRRASISFRRTPSARATRS